jgi:chromosomal replication initiator protein
MSESNLKELWERCLKVVADNIPNTAFKTWFVPIVPLKFENNQLTIQVPTNFFYEILEDRYIDLISRTIRKHFGEGVKLGYKVVVDAGAEKNGTILEQSANNTVLPPAKPEFNGNKAPSMVKSLDSHLIPQYTFDNFVEGSSNKFSRSIAEEVAKKPADTPFNPLFIYGPSGVGKTHLINAVGMRIKESFPEKRVLYVSAHLFKLQYMDAAVNNTVPDFIHFYQTIDVLIIDDIQEIAGVTKTQNTLFHIFNHLYRNRKQLIFTSDRSPVLLQGFSDRLMTRMKCGIVTELEKPTAELRKNIVRRKVYRDGLQFPDEVIDYIGENVNNSVRELEGIINSIMAHATVYNRDVDLALTKQIVQKIVRYEKKKINVDDIVKTVCKHYGLELSAIHAKTRKSDVVQARQVAMYLTKKYTDYSIAKIGQLIGNKNHATVIYAYRTIKGQVDVDKAFRTEIEELEKTLETATV